MVTVVVDGVLAVDMEELALDRDIVDIEALVLPAVVNGAVVNVAVVVGNLVLMLVLAAAGVGGVDWVVVVLVVGFSVVVVVLFVGKVVLVFLMVRVEVKVAVFALFGTLVVDLEELVLVRASVVMVFLVLV